VTLALVSGVTTAKPAWALCYCQTNNDYSTPENWGMGADCTAAQNDLAIHVNSVARADCGATQTCLGTLHLVNACWWNGTMYQADGYRDYSCKVCGIPQQ